MLPGEFRRDCEPYTGNVALLGYVGLVLTLLSACVIPASLPALVLGVVALRRARRDLEMMDAGLMDPTQRSRARDAEGAARLAVTLSLQVLGLYGVLGLVVLVLWLWSVYGR